MKKYKYIVEKVCEFEYETTDFLEIDHFDNPEDALYLSDSLNLENKFDNIIYLVLIERINEE